MPENEMKKTAVEQLNPIPTAPEAEAPSVPAAPATRPQSYA